MAARAPARGFRESRCGAAGLNGRELVLYRLTSLDNGVRVATAEMPHMASVSVGIWVAVGGRYEPSEVSGVSHFIEHLLFKGTRRRTARRISEEIEGLGGYINAFTAEENTCYYSRARADRFEELLDVLTDMYLNSRFDPEEIDKERQVIKEELAMYLDQPHQHVQELLNETLWPDHPLGRSLTGSEETLDGLDRSKIVGFQRGNYVTANTLVVAAGNLRHKEHLARAKRLAARVRPGERPRFQPAAIRQDRPRTRLHTKNTEQTQLAMALRTCSRHDGRRYSLRLLNAVLGENMSSRLFQTLREEHGLAYSIYSSLGFFDDDGSLTISAGLDTAKLPKALDLIVREMRAMTERAPSAAELRRARDYLIGQIDLSLESTENQMMWLGEQVLNFGKITPPATVKRRLAEVKPSEVKAAARDFFRADRVSMAVVSPLKTLRHVAGKLKELP